MTPVPLSNLLNIAHALERCRLRTGFYKDKLFVGEDYPPFLADLCLIENVAKVFALPVTQAKAARIIDRKDVSSRGAYYREVIDLQSRFDDEINGIVFLHLPAKHQQCYLLEKPLFGEEVRKAFPSAAYDIEEAGKCFGLGRYTAAVLHLMRVLEVALQVLRTSLKVRYSEKKSWNGVLIDLQAKCKAIEKRRRKPKSWRNNRQFYSEVFVEFDHLKDAWRNHAMHARATYDEERAENIMDHVQRLLRHLATKLNE